MRRVYLSFLGTNPYFECNYYQDGFGKVSGVRFVQEATIKWYCTRWTEQDSITIFTTDEAFKKNWHDGTDKDNKIIPGLESCLSRIKLNVGFNHVHIPSGKNTAEIWEIFETVFNELQDEDRVYLDITHAFRSLPLLSLVILNYAKVTRDVKIKAISYGAMEAIGQAGEVKNMPLDQRNVPVFDLLAFDQLLDWSTAVDRFTGSGDASLVAMLAKREINRVLRETRGRDQEAQAVKLLAKNMEELSDAVATCRARTIPSFADRLKSSLKGARAQEHVKPLSPLFEKLERQIRSFSGDEIHDGLVAVQWCIDHNLVQQGITIFLETMVSYVVRKALSGDIHQEDLRKIVNQGLRISLEEIPEEKWPDLATSNSETTHKIIAWFDEHEKVAKCFANLIQPRNDINHAGQNDSPMTPAKFRKRLKEEVERFMAAAEI